MSAGRVFSQIPPPPHRVRFTTSLHSTDCTPPNQGVQQRILNWGGAINISQDLLPPKSTRTSVGCSDCSTPQRTLDGKFLDSDNGDCSAVVAEYDEQKEREIAEAICDWWISKKPFKQWFAEKYQQGTLDFGEDNEQ